MTKVLYYPCMVLDAICYLGQHTNKQYRNVMVKDEVEFYEKIDKLTESKLIGEYLGTSTLSLIISTYTGNINLENYSLLDLIKVFEKPEDINKIVRQRITNPFTISYVIQCLNG